jgi:iron complex outermembrane receptor protein
MIHRSPRLLPALLLAAAVAPVPAGAQTSGSPAADTARTASDTLDALPLAPVEVTVLRTPEQGARVPYAVSALDREELARGRSGAFLEEALDGLAGVQVQNRFNYAVGERLAIRGFGSRAQFGIRGVKVLVDGIPATMPDGQSTLDHLDLGSLGRAEVLRGPGSALYGNGAGGVLAFRSRSPWEGDVRQELRTVGGSNGLLDLRSLTTGSVGSTGYLASISRFEWDGFRDNPVEGGSYGAADRIQLNTQLTRPLAGGEIRGTFNLLNLDAENPSSLDAETLAEGTPARGFAVRQGTGKEVSQRQGGLVWEGPVGSAGLEVAGWALTRSVLNPIPPSIIDLDRRAGGGRALLRGESGPLRWSAGAEAEFQRDDRRNFDNDGGEATALTLDQLERVRSTGAFGRLGWGVASGVELTGSLRYDRVRFEAEDRFFVGGDPDDSGSRTLDAWSPSVGITVEAAPGVRLWANLATALETPTTTELANRPDGSGGFNPGLDPARARTLEAGVRGAAAGGRLGWEVAAFQTRIDDELVPFEVPGAPGRTFFRNAGESSHEGLEAMVRARPAPGWELDGAWTWVDARYEDFVVEGTEFSGNRIPGLAPHRVEGDLTREGDDWFVTLEAEWTDEVPVDDANTATADAYTLVDLRAGLERVSVDRWDVSPFAAVTNLGDTRYVSAVTVNAFGGRYYEPGPGRMFTVGATVAWSRR